MTAAAEPGGQTVPAQVLRVVVHAPSRQPVLLLGEIGGTRCVPIFLRQPQADVISLGPRGERDLPLTQDLLLPVVRALGHRLTAARVSALVDGVYRAELLFDADTAVPVSPSDALAVAVREDLPILLGVAVLDEVGQPISELFPDGGAAPPERQLREFHEFVQEVDPDDFRDPPT